MNSSRRAGRAVSTNTALPNNTKTRARSQCKAASRNAEASMVMTEAVRFVRSLRGSRSRATRFLFIEASIPTHHRAHKRRCRANGAPRGNPRIATTVGVESGSNRSRTLVPASHNRPERRARRPAVSLRGPQGRSNLLSTVWSLDYSRLLRSARNDNRQTVMPTYNCSARPGDPYFPSPIQNHQSTIPNCHATNLLPH
jgi:hypothetical protein